MNLPPDRKQIRLSAVGVLALALFTLFDAWAVYAAGSLARVSCSGSFQRTSCSLGSVLGRLFEPSSPWLGYVLFHGVLGTFLAASAYLLYVRSKA